MLSYDIYSSFSSILLTETRNHGCTRPATLTPLIHTRQRLEDILDVGTSFARLAQLMSKDIEHKLAIAVGVDVPMSDEIEELGQLWRINEVAIVGKANAMGAVAVKRLRFRTVARAGCWVSKMADSHCARALIFMLVSCC